MSKAVVRGMETAPTRRSATAMLANKMFEFFCNALRLHTATIIIRFNNTVKGLAMDFAVIET